MLQSLAIMCCSVLQSVAVCCRVLQCVAVSCSELHNIAELRYHVTTYELTMSASSTPSEKDTSHVRVMSRCHQYTLMCCSVMQCNAVC